LGLKDEDSAKRLFFSNILEKFTGIGAQLIQRLIRELQSSIGFYEVQTGLTIGQMVCIQFPPKLAWITDVVADELGIKMLQPDVVTWLTCPRHQRFPTRFMVTLPIHGGSGCSA
jgi:hypothetical protein